MRNGLTLYRKFDRSPFAGVMNDFEELFARALREPTSLTTDLPTQAESREWFQPRVELEESEQAYHLSIDLPGVKKEDLKIDLTDRILSVSGERRRTREVTTGETPTRSESSGRFERKFTLPDSVNIEKVEADLKDGVLTLELPKRESLKPRTIEVRAK